MSQEAWNTERHVVGWGATKLRENGINFVSAGHLVGDQPPSTQTDRGSTGPQVEVATSQAAQCRPIAQVEQAVLSRASSKASTEEHVVDAPVDQSIRHNMDTFRPRRMSASSSSGSEEILFAGRLHPSKKPASGKSEVSRSVDVQLSSPDPISSVSMHDTQPQAPPFVDQMSRLFQVGGSTSSDAHQSLGEQRRTTSGRYRNSRAKRWEQVSDEEAIMQDYIANMAMDDDNDDDDDEGDEEEGVEEPRVRRNEHFRFFDGAGEENVKVQIRGSKRPSRSRGDFGQAADWSSADLEDFDDLSTTDEEIMDIGQVLRHRERATGVQYLVTAVGRDASDAKWILHEKLTSKSAQEEIQIFEEIRTMDFAEGLDDGTGSSGSSDDEEALDDLLEDIESEDEENARVMRRTARMTDEQVALAIAKQEELGLGGDELLIFNGQEGIGDGAAMSDDDSTEDDGFIPFSAKKHTSNRTRARQSRRQRDSFPAASAFADALDQDPYGGFDVMDFDRPSLRPRKKGRKSDPFELGLEDDELAEQIQTSWFKDREKKAARKRIKEEARQATLLDASTRNEPSQIKAEIRRFLVQEVDTLELAPMDASLRAAVHRLAKALRLNSQSRGKDGKGAGRYPVLTKTPRTPYYSVDTIWEIDALLNTRKFFPKHGGGSYKGARASRIPTARMRRSGGGGTLSGATYMNGEVVGASAPEIGSDNKGRAILEKMGWTSGMGIGAIGNQGSLEAIKHVVKTTKAGLG